MNADAGMGPYGDDGKHLHDTEPREQQPLRDKDGAVIRADIEHALGNARRHHMERQQHGDAQAERKLRQLPRIEPQRAPNINRPQRIAVMDEKRRYQKSRAEKTSPRIHEHLACSFGRLERNKKKAVRGEVADHKAKHDQRAAEPQPASPLPKVPGRRHDPQPSSTNEGVTIDRLGPRDIPGQIDYRRLSSERLLAAARPRSRFSEITATSTVIPRKSSVLPTKLPAMGTA